MDTDGTDIGSSGVDVVGSKVVILCSDVMVFVVCFVVERKAPVLLSEDVDTTVV